MPTCLVARPCGSVAFAECECFHGSPVPGHRVVFIGSSLSLSEFLAVYGKMVLSRIGFGAEGSGAVEARAYSSGCRALLAHMSYP